MDKQITQTASDTVINSIRSRSLAKNTEDATRQDYQSTPRENKEWVRINRSILESELWTASKFSRGQAMLDLMLLSSQTDCLIKKRFGKKHVEIQLLKGQLCVSSRELAKRWKWNYQDVFRFLSLLENEGVITYRSTSSNTIITIVDFDKYPVD